MGLGRLASIIAFGRGYLEFKVDEMNGSRQTNMLRTIELAVKRAWTLDDVSRFRASNREPSCCEHSDNMRFLKRQGLDLGIILTQSPPWLAVSGARPRHRRHDTVISWVGWWRFEASPAFVTDRRKSDCYPFWWRFPAAPAGSHFLWRVPA